MKISKLEQYIELLNTLGQKSSQKLTNTLDEINNSDGLLKKSMGFLIKQGLVKQRSIGKQVAYNNTQKGRRVSRYFSDPLQESPDRQLVSAELLPESVPSLNRLSNDLAGK